MDIGRGLPRFVLKGFMEYVSKGAEMRKEVEEAERRERQRQRLDKDKRRKRQAWKEMWTTDGQRPLTEPPILDWDYFFRYHIPSDLRYKALFPIDPEKRAAIKDLQGEHAVLVEYGVFASLMEHHDPAVDDPRRGFYQALYQDLYADYQEVDVEYCATYSMATALCRFEYRFLDNDGKTTRLENWLKKGANIFYGSGEEAKQKYQYLVPPDFVEDPLATFDFFWLEGDGKSGNIRYALDRGEDILVGWPQEVQDKYGHLRDYPPTPT